MKEDLSVHDAESPNQFIQLHRYSTWQLIKAYWQSQHRSRIYLATGVILLLTLLLVGFEVVFNYWYNYFYNALQAYNLKETIRLLVIFFIIAAFYIVFGVYRFYISQVFQLRWRRWLTEQLVGRWLQKKGYYFLETFDPKTDNPDQRIQEDIMSLVTNALDLAVGLVSAVVTILAFIYILWNLSGILTFRLGALGTWHIPGYLVWVSVTYSLVGTWFTFKIGRPLIGLNFEQQHREANFRFSAIDLRAHAEPIALYRGEVHQKNILNRSLQRVLENWYAIIIRQRLLLWYTSGYGQAAVVLPLLVALPNYFGKVFLLGGLIQSLSAFRSMQDSLSFLVNAYTQIATWRATSQRLTGFINHLDEIEEKAQQADHLRFEKTPEPCIISKQVSIDTPQGELLLDQISETFVHGKHYLIKGESGLGKSTYMRTLAGIWPYAAGEIYLPEHQKMMFLPQRPYMPLGSLTEAILFPNEVVPGAEIEIENVLRECHLEKLIPRLSEVAAWSEQLSPGEQQRIAFARIFLQKPDWVFLDESTSMLDLANERYLYQLLKTKLPHCSIVSVGHRPSLDEFHDHVVNIAKYNSKTAEVASC